MLPLSCVYIKQLYLGKCEVSSGKVAFSCVIDFTSGNFTKVNFHAPSITCDQVLFSFHLVSPFLRKHETKNRAPILMSSPVRVNKRHA